MAVISQVKLNNVYSSLTPVMVTTASSASAQNKIATVTNFSFETGTRILLKLTNGNSHISPTLNINSSGAKSIVGNGSCKPSYFSHTNAMMQLLYDGTSWQILG